MSLGASEIFQVLCKLIQMRKPRLPYLLQHLLNAKLTRFGCAIGLFTANQKPKGDSAIYTRQNAAGTRRGLEVPEERDYYPYWGPTPWSDIAIMVSNKRTADLMKKYVNSPEYGYKCEFLFQLDNAMSILFVVLTYIVSMADQFISSTRILFLRSESSLFP